MSKHLFYILLLFLIPKEIFCSNSIHNISGALDLNVCAIAIVTIVLILLIRDSYVNRNRIKQFKHLESIIESRTKELQEQNNELVSINEELLKAKNHIENEVKDKEKFYSLLAHDLKSPFNVLIGASEILIDEKESLSLKSRNELIQEIYLASSNTFKLLENLLDWTRSQTGKIKVNAKKVNLLHATEEVLDTIKIIAKHKGVKIKLSISEDIYVFADPSMLAAIIRNLIANAVKFSYPDSKVRVEAYTKESTVFLKIADTGIGIDAARLGVIFDKAKANSTLGTSQEKGTGLGLILCNEFAERNNGKLDVESVEGEGSTFTLELPVS